VIASGIAASESATLALVGLAGLALVAVTDARSVRWIRSSIHRIAGVVERWLRHWAHR
jgi:hypothetical protein